MSISKPTLVLVPLLVWLASFGGAEIAFRLLGQQPTNELAGMFEQFGATFKHRPNVKADANWVGGRFSVITDGDDLRCGAREAGRPATSSADVLVIGDSQAFGQGLSYEDTLVGRLAAAAGPELTIRNVAVGGHYLEDQFKLVHRLYERGMRPKAAIVLMTPYLVASAGRENHAKVGADGRLYSEHGEKWYRGLTMWLKTHTVVYGQVRNALRSFVPDETPAAVGFFAANTEASDQGRLTQSLGAFQQWASARDIPLLVVYTPLAMELNFTPVAQAAQAAHVQVDRDMPFRVAEAVAGSLHIGFYDLRPALAHREAARQPLSLYKDPHYNAATSSACADDLWRAIESRGILRSSSRVVRDEQLGNRRDDAATAVLHSRAVRDSQ